VASRETEEEKQERRLQEGIGVSQIVIDCAAATDSSKTPFTLAVETGKLPSADEVCFCMSCVPFLVDRTLATVKLMVRLSFVCRLSVRL